MSSSHESAVKENGDEWERYLSFPPPTLSIKLAGGYKEMSSILAVTNSARVYEPK
jgi:hypothetical protein